MTKIITPGIFLVAVLTSAGCTDPEDVDPKDETPDVAACCAPDRPSTSEPLYDSFDLGRQARSRLDFLQRIASGKR